MPVSWIEHKGKRILYADYRNQMGPAMVQTLELEIAEIRKHGKGALLLGDFRGSSTNDDFMTKAKGYGKELRDLSHRSAALGISGVKKILLGAYNAFSGDKIRAFDTEEEAKAHLIS
jgi:hypothetical protein